MTDIKVPHEYLNTLREIDAAIRGHDVDAGAVVALLDRLIAAAEADQPLPEGWYVWDDVRAVWFDGKRSLYTAPGRDYFGLIHEVGLDCLTPLRSTATEADVEKAARAARAAYFGGPERWDTALRGDRDDWMKAVRAALDALDIEVVTP